MEEQFINLTLENIEKEHICCAISDKKHQAGVDIKKKWLQARIKEGHIFRKLNQKGKVFIEYAPLETAWVPVEGDNYIYIYCLWVSGSFKNKGYGKKLLQYCIDEAKDQKKSGICVISSNKKKPFLSDKKFMEKNDFKVVDKIGEEYELLALSFDGSNPRFKSNAKKQTIDMKELVVYYGLQCPYIPNCVKEIKTYCDANKVKINFVKIDTLEKAKNVPCVFNNWAVFYNREFKTLHLLNEGYIKKLLEK
ncbi:MAG: acetyltransferase [Clostridiales bacterium]|nr:acetyltransferase [Clostridiales bacterium]